MSIFDLINNIVTGLQITVRSFQVGPTQAQQEFASTPQIPIRHVNSLPLPNLIDIRFLPFTSIFSNLNFPVEKDF